jgi:hypothetical protein
MPTKGKTKKDPKVEKPGVWQDTAWTMRIPAPAVKNRVGKRSVTSTKPKRKK